MAAIVGHPLEPLAPDAAWLSTQTPVSTDPELMLEYRWLVERFSVTDLSEWSLSSLHREYQWAKGDGPRPATPTS
jgi:hypothetical protein